MTALHLKLERALHYYDEGYDSGNDYDPPGTFIWPACIYLVSVTEASINPVNDKGAQDPNSPSTPKQPRDELPLCQAVY